MGNFHDKLGAQDVIFMHRIVMSQSIVIYQVPGIDNNEIHISSPHLWENIVLP